MSIPLSVLDLMPVVRGSTPSEALRASVHLARRAEALGYLRYWVAEHHNTSGLASASPAIAIATLARETRSLRIGAGGVMLPNHSPLQVAEDFRLLEALYPGRIDLGLGRAPGTDLKTALALRRSRERLRADDFPDELAELEGYADDRGPIVATPTGVPLPPIWLLSSSGFGAQLAAQQGRPFAFAHHFSPEPAAEAMAAYRRTFQPSKHLAKPYALLTVAALCAETDERAEALARCVDLMWVRFVAGDRGLFPTVEEAQAHRFSDADLPLLAARRASLFFGTPARLKLQLETLARQLGADELMVSAFIGVPEERVRSYELLAQAFGLTGPA